MHITNRIKLSFAWYDIWIGFYYDKNSHTLYFCPLPMLVFQFDCMKYYNIIGHYLHLPIGKCSQEGIRDVLEEEPGSTFVEISKKQFYDDDYE
jgi:hypothetical protein